MARNELTSKRISTIAGRILRNDPPDRDRGIYFIGGESDGTFAVTGKELKALAASALTQTADKPKRKRTKNVKRSK